MAESQDFSAFLDRLADTASEAIMPHFRAATTVHDKGENRFDPVTIADRNAEQAMRRLISTTYPEHGIVGEEFGSERADAEYVWILDPIDGTRAFITGLPVWGVLIGLLHNGVPTVGMMAQPFTRERFAGDGTRAWYSGPTGGRALRVRPCSGLAAASMFTTTPAIFTGADRAAYDRVEDAARLARYGCDCYAYCMVAAGHADAVVEASLQPFDIAPLIPIITGAGGQVTNWEGGSAAGGGRVAATGDARVHAEVLARLAG